MDDCEYVKMYAGKDIGGSRIGGDVQSAMERVAREVSANRDTTSAARIRRTPCPRYSPSRTFVREPPVAILTSCPGL